MQQHYNSDYFRWQEKLGQIGGLANLFKFSHSISPNDNVLEFGCGGGYLLNNIQAANKTGYDINPSALEEAKKKISITNDLHGLNDNSYDVIISNHALEHCHSPYHELKVLYSKLKPEGKIIFVVPHEKAGQTWKPNDINNHLYTWNEMTLGNLFVEAGFKIIEVKTIRHQWPPKAILLWKLLGPTLFNYASIYKSLYSRALSDQNSRHKNN